MNKIKIIADTSADFTEEEARAMNLAYVPFTIDVADTTYIDDDKLDLDALYTDMKASADPVRTGCPSPFLYKEAILASGANEIFVVTITAKLSGSYNAAKTAVEEIQKQHPEK